VVCHHVARAGILGASFEGGRKCGRERRRLLEYSVQLSQPWPNNDSFHEIQFEIETARPVVR
jgi:hypothetical protein